MMKVYGLVLLGMVLVSGCAMSPMNSAMYGDTALEVKQFAEANRKLIWEAELTVEVATISNAVEKAVTDVEAVKGYVEEKTFWEDKSAHLTLRVPAQSLKGAIGRLESLGKVTSHSISSTDVTEKYVDVESRLKNKKVLRDRLKLLLDKATAVKDVLAIEKELNRVQSDIDSMEAQIRSLSGRVDYATINLQIRRRKIYGPIGFVFKWTGNLFGKLFVIQE
jgi:PBP1b-binding outer membrane lipoprotein LpoB